MKTRSCLLVIIATFTTLHTAYAYVSNEEIRAKQRIEDIKTCESSLPGAKAKYAELMGERKFWKAAGALRFCASTLPNNSDLNALIADAEIKEHQAVIKDPKASKVEKNKAKERLVIDYPVAGKEYANDVVKQGKADEAMQARRLKSQGVKIGMSQAEVVASSWGKPKNVSRTSTAYGATEIWHYGFPNFLYFENGILTQIHN